MYNKELLLDILQQVSSAVKRVRQRFEPVTSADYFTDTPQGMEKLDAICMLLIAIGESLKKVDKIAGKQLLDGYPEIDWKGAKGMRDIMSHHYFDIDAEQIYWVCTHNMQPLAETIDKIICDLKK